MKQKICTVLAVMHMVCVSVSTLVASFVIESIIVSGAICVLVALISFVFSLMCKRYWLAFAEAATLLVGIAFVISEVILFMLGPERAALPLCLLFLAVQLVTITVTLNDLQRQISANSVAKPQVSIKSLMICTTLFAVAFAATESFPAEMVPHISSWSVAFRYPWLIAISVFMLLFMAYGLFSIVRDARKLKGLPVSIAE